MNQNELFDVIVVGAGHAGIEASLAPARMGLKTLVVTNNLERVGYMSCNPSIGGLGKGHIVKEIDALGGAMAEVADQSCVQFKRLNGRKGPAVRGSRAQCDKAVYSRLMAQQLLNTPHLQVLGGEVSSLILEDSKCAGVVLQDGSRIRSKTVIIATGTFMKAVMHFGLKQIPGGRVGDEATAGISDQLADFGFKVTRLKTGTPPRLDGTSIDWSKMEEQFGDDRFIPFSFKSRPELQLPQISCFLAYTNGQTHEIIRKNLNKSPMFTGVIKGIGPRYCPSIEDKITRFADKPKHQTFLEPEGVASNSIYLQGISTSLPEEVQYEFLRTIPGLEKVRLLRPGYAVEYDFIEPTQIRHTLETRLIGNLYLAGQINGTSGYEEAAGQGLVAGINAALRVQEKEPFILGREEAYIGVMVDDLVTKGTKEPYRMMTSRAEHRLVLREDNSLDRLARRGYDVGSLLATDFSLAESIAEKKKKMFTDLRKINIYPNENTQQKLREIPTPVLQKPSSLEVLLRRTEVHCSDLRAFGLEYDEDFRVAEAVEIEVKYSGYIKREQQLVIQAKRLEKLKIPNNIKYLNVRGLSSEEVEKLSEVLPGTLGQAQRISGVNPSAIQALMIHLKGQQRKFAEIKL